MTVYKCERCNRTFDKPIILYDYRQVGEEDYEDVYKCPYCGCEDMHYEEVDNG